jgi:hypothetical protein
MPLLFPFFRGTAIPSCALHGCNGHLQVAILLFLECGSPAAAFPAQYAYDEDGGCPTRRICVWVFVLTRPYSSSRAPSFSRFRNRCTQRTGVPINPNVARN